MDIILNGQKHSILAARPVEGISNRYLCLLCAIGEEETNYSLWLIEVVDDGKSLHSWPYRGSESAALALIQELAEEYLETVFSE